MKKTLFAFFVLVLTAAPAFCQMVDQATAEPVRTDYLGIQPVSKPFSLIDLSRIHWSNSYSLSFFSGGGTSGSIGLLTSSVLYDISPALSLGLRLSVAHEPGSLFNRNVNSNALLLPGFNLDYHPSDKFRLMIGVESYPGLYNNPYAPYWYYPWRYAH